MKCNRCSREISEEERYIYQGAVFCEDCLMDVGLSTKECDPWASYVDTHTRKRAGQTGAAGLTKTEKKIYEFVTGRGKATRKEVMEKLSLSELDLTVQLIPLMHFELIKERSEGDEFYLIAIN